MRRQVHILTKIKNKGSVNSFQKILIFRICVSSENTQYFVGALLNIKENPKKTDERKCYFKHV